MINSIITIFLYVNTSWMWMSQQIIPSYREKNYVCARNRSPEVFNAQLLDQNVARHSICPVPNHYPPWLDWKGSEFHHKKVQKSKSAVVQGLEGISTSTVTGGPGGPGEGLRVGLRLGSLELRRQGLGGLFKYGGHKTRESRLENGSKWNKIWIVHGKYD